MPFTGFPKSYSLLLFIGAKEDIFKFHSESLKPTRNFYQS